MNLVQYLQTIKPGLTLYGVLITFAITAFALGKFFWRYDKELINENINRVKDILSNYRHMYIEPILNTQLSQAIKDTYEITINGIISDIYPKETLLSGEIRRDIVDDPTLKLLVSEESLKSRMEFLKSNDNSIETFLSSASGNELFDKLDHAYENCSKMTIQYRKSRRECIRASYSFLALSFFLLIAIVRVFGPWPEFLKHLWLILVLETGVLGLYFFIRLEFFRRSLLRTWEELQFYGKL